MVASSADVTVFVSHSSVDSALARALVELFEKALKLSSRDFRCTSVDGYRLPAGANTEEQLRREVIGAKVFIGLITPASASSAYVLFELGARWGAKRYLAPVLSRSTDTDLLGGPLSGFNALVLSERNQALQLVQDVANHLGLSLEPISSFQAAVDNVVSVAQSGTAEKPHVSKPVSAPDVTDEGVHVLQALAAVSDDTSADRIASHLNVSEQKARYYLEELASQEMVQVHPMMYGVTTYSILQRGRALLVSRNLL